MSDIGEENAKASRKMDQSDITTKETKETATVTANEERARAVDVAKGSIDKAGIKETATKATADVDRRIAYAKAESEKKV